MDAAKLAVEEHVGRPLGLDVMDAAEAIIRVANSKMAGAIRLVSIERGHDPKRFSAMPFGGGGALHAGSIDQGSGLKKRNRAALFPVINSALGCTIADMRHDFVQTINSPLEFLDIDDLNQRIGDLATKGIALLSKAGVEFKANQIVVELDMSYQGQTHTVNVPLPVQSGGGSGDSLGVGMPAV